MNKSQKADLIINSSTAAATALAVVPIPVADIVAITSIQITLIVNLGILYNKTISRHIAHGLKKVYFAGMAGSYLASLVKAIPGIGTTLGGMAQMFIAGTITFRLGLRIKQILEKDLELNKANLQRKETIEEKEQVKSKREELKRLIKKTKDAKESICFKSQPKNITNEVRFFFLLTGYDSAHLRINSKNGATVFEKEIQTKYKSTKWNTSDLKPGQYLAFLECPGLLPICLDLKKVKK